MPDLTETELREQRLRLPEPTRMWDPVPAWDVLAELRRGFETTGRSEITFRAHRGPRDAIDVDVDVSPCLYPAFCAQAWVHFTIHTSVGTDDPASVLAWLRFESEDQSPHLALVCPVREIPQKPGALAAMRGEGPGLVISAVAQAANEVNRIHDWQDLPITPDELHDVLDAGPPLAWNIGTRVRRVRYALAMKLHAQARETCTLADGRISLGGAYLMLLRHIMDAGFANDRRWHTKLARHLRMSFATVAGRKSR